MKCKNSLTVSFGVRRVLFIALQTVLVVTVINIGVEKSRSQSRDSKTSHVLPRFEVATVKASDPNGHQSVGFHNYPGGSVVITRYTLQMLIMKAFDVEAFQIKDAPHWSETEDFSIQAKPPASSDLAKSNPESDRIPLNKEQREMLQTLLVDRFQLKFHKVIKTGPVYFLTKGGKKILLSKTAYTGSNAYPWFGDPEGGIIYRPTGIAAHNISMPILASKLSFYFGRPVIDQTGIGGLYDIEYRLTEDAGADVLASIITSIRGIGLNLVSAKGPVETIVIDHVERPSGNY